MKLRTLKAHFAVEFIDIEKAAQVMGAKWEAFQIQFLNNTSRFGCDVKSRQIAWSFTAALDAIVDSILVPNTPHIFVSINMDEAGEKIRYARAILDAMDDQVKPEVVADSASRIEIANGSRLISHPCRPVRGKARSRVYLDEMAHYLPGLDRQIYLAALPATTKGDGYIRIGSSPLGASGMFWDIYTQSSKEWSGYVRNYIPWWAVRALCTDLQRAAVDAPALVTEERVREFGTAALLEIYDNMFLEDFQQEYECAWVDESVAWISWDLIKRNQQADLTWFHAKNIQQAHDIISQIQNAVATGAIETALVGGIDIGRKKNLTEFVICGKTTTGHLPLRAMISLDRVEYDDQQAIFEDVISRLPFIGVMIDENGIGAQLAEHLNRRFSNVYPATFTAPNKELWATHARISAERAIVPIPIDRDLAYQIHSLKKFAGARFNIFDTDGNDKHHADKFWAWALAIYMGIAPPQTISQGYNPLTEYRG